MESKGERARKPLTSLLLGKLCWMLCWGIQKTNPQNLTRGSQDKTKTRNRKTRKTRKTRQSNRPRIQRTVPTAEQEVSRSSVSGTSRELSPPPSSSNSIIEESVRSIACETLRPDSKSLSPILSSVIDSGSVLEVQECGKDKYSVSGVDSKAADSNSFLTMIEACFESVEVIPEPITAVAKLSYEAEREFKRISAVAEELQLQETHVISKALFQESSDKEHQGTLPGI